MPTLTRTTPAERVTTSFTQAFATALRGVAPGTRKTAESHHIALAIKAALVEYPIGGWLDSHAAADVLHEYRCSQGKDADWDQTRDYVQHLLREASHVCRHADGHHYHLHAAETCSSLCDSRRTQTKRGEVQGGSCAKCNSYIPPALTECEFCG